MQKIIPCLWFDSNAEEAVNFYTSIFKKLKDPEHYSLWRGRDRNAVDQLTEYLAKA